MQKQDIVGYRTPLDAARRYKLEKVKVLKVADDGSVAEVMLKGDAKDGSKITLKADQIDLKGKNINLTGDDVTISSTNFNVTSTGAVTASSLALTGGSITLGSNFSVDSSGVLNCTNANVSGTITSSNGAIGGFTLAPSSFSTILTNPYTYTDADVARITQIVQGTIIPTAEDYAKYDFNRDGEFDTLDMLICQQLKLGILPASYNFKIDTSNPISAFQIYDNNRTYASIGAFGANFDISVTTKNLHTGSIFSNSSISCVDLYVSGSKNRVVSLDSGKKVLINAYETATPYFGDIGSNKTNKNGYCKIDIEEIFGKTIERDDYKVFIQECGEGNLYVEKKENYFEVKGTPNLNFDWEIKAIQKGFKDVRLQEYIEREDK